MDGNGIVRNRILQALVDRIERAVQRDESNIRSHKITNLHAVMHWQFATICRGRYSLFKALKGVTDRRLCALDDVNCVPTAADRIDLRDFEVDNYRDRKKKLFSMDHDGWCYARNFSVFQEVRTM
ncbi:hypothetical protein PsorP6_018347 [Peronosclerospora sorghi]|nr:hypothetical protein PsorP6_018347 [Peronosclerospora sorghi]